MAERLAVVVPVFNEPGIGRTLEALYRQSERTGMVLYVVDNGSSDDTRVRIEAFGRLRRDFPLVVLDEEQKGTGAAADTGFRRAIADGFPLVARTDGDSEPRPDWTARIRRNFAGHPSVQLLGGTSVPLPDAYRRRFDGVLLAFLFPALRGALALRHRDPACLRIVAGHNLAVRSSAYERAGGFPRSSIDERDEDVELTLRVARTFGRRAVRIDRRLRVATSMRRIRRYGVLRTGLRHLRAGAGPGGSAPGGSAHLP